MWGLTIYLMRLADYIQFEEILDVKGLYPTMMILA